MRKIYLLFLMLFLLVFTGNEGFALNYVPDTVAVFHDSSYCVGATTVAPLTGTVTLKSCTGIFTGLPLTCRWYSSLVNSNNPLVPGVMLLSTTTSFATTTASGSSIITPTYTPLTTTSGTLYYFCIISYGANICTITADSNASNVVRIVVGPPLFLSASLSPNPICTGDSVYFSALAVGDSVIPIVYQWHGPGTSGFATGASPPPFSVNSADSGWYRISATNSCGTSIDSVHLTIHTRITSVSVTPAINDTFCTGGSLALHGTVVGGTGLSYSWTGPNGFTSTLLNPTTINPATTHNSGVYTFVVTAGGCPSDTAHTAVVWVDTTAIIISDTVYPNPICAGYLINLVDSEKNATHFMWVGLNTLHDTFRVQHPAPFPATLLDSGAYVFIVSNSCNTAKDTTYHLVVRKSPTLIFGSDTTICASPGSLIQFSDTTVGGHWSSSATAIASVNTVGGVTGLSPGIAIIYYSISSGCYDSVRVTVGQPVGPIRGNTVICVGDSTLLTDASTGGNWSSGAPAIATIGGLSGMAIGVSTGIATITYITAGCPSTTFTLDVIATPSRIMGNLSVCVGGSSTLTDATLGDTWTIFNTTNATITTISSSSAIISGLKAGIDTVYYTGGDGCAAIAVINVDTLPAVAFHGADSICQGECAILHVTPVPHATYLWEPTTGISCTDCDSVKACPQESQTYTVVITNGAGCKDSAMHRLIINPLPQLIYNPDPFYMCNGSTKQIFVSDAITANHTNIWSWYPNDSISSLTVSDPVFSDIIDLVYTVVGTSIYGCKDSIRIPVSVLDSANTTITPDTVICIGNHHIVSVTSTDPNSTYQWFILTPGGGIAAPTSLSSSTYWAPVATPTVTTTYGCTITENACFSATRYTTVFVDPMPKLLIAPPSTQIAGSSVTLQVTITNSPPDTGLTWEWTPPESVSCPSCPTTIATPTASTTYSVCVTTNWGCTSCDTVRVLLICDNSQVFIPNTFSPNGDGINDKFIVSGKGLGFVTHMTVFNRWGQVMYDVHDIPANDMSYGWDGTFQGQVLEPDVFMYVIEVMCETEGVSFKFHGDISLVR